MSGNFRHKPAFSNYFKQGRGGTRRSPVFSKFAGWKVKKVQRAEDRSTRIIKPSLRSNAPRSGASVNCRATRCLRCRHSLSQRDRLHHFRYPHGSVELAGGGGSHSGGTAVEVRFDDLPHLFPLLKERSTYRRSMVIWAIALPIPSVAFLGCRGYASLTGAGNRGRRSSGRWRRRRGGRRRSRGAFS